MALSILPLPQIVKGINYSSYVLPGIVAYTITTNGIYGLAYWMAEMRSRNVIKRFLVAPVKVRDLALALVASRLVIMFCQVALLTLIGVFLFDTPFAGNYLSVIILTILGGAVFLLIGLLIANYSSSYETATPITTAIGMPMMFLGNVFFPVETLPQLLRPIGKILPITFLAEGLRHSYLSAFDCGKLSGNLLGLGIWLVILLVTTIKVFQLKE